MLRQELGARLTFPVGEGGREVETLGAVVVESAGILLLPVKSRTVKCWAGSGAVSALWLAEREVDASAGGSKRHIVTLRKNKLVLSFVITEVINAHSRKIRNFRIEKQPYHSATPKAATIKFWCVYVIIVVIV